MHYQLSRCFFRRRSAQQPPPRPASQPPFTQHSQQKPTQEAPQIPRCKNQKTTSQDSDAKLPAEHTEAGSNTFPTTGRLEVRAPEVSSAPQSLHTALCCNLPHKEDYSQRIQVQLLPRRALSVLQGLQKQSTVIFQDQVQHSTEQERTKPPQDQAES